MPTRCWEPPPEEVPESAAYLHIIEHDPTGQTPPAEVFRGWMFASSPSLNPLEYPTLDVWMLDCRRARAASPDSTDEVSSSP